MRGEPMGRYHRRRHVGIFELERRRKVAATRRRMVEHFLTALLGIVLFAGVALACAGVLWLFVLPVADFIEAIPPVGETVAGWLR